MNVILLVLVLCSIIFKTSAEGNQYEAYFSQVATHDNWERLCYQFTNPSIKAAAFLTML